MIVLIRVEDGPGPLIQLRLGLEAYAIRARLDYIAILKESGGSSAPLGRESSTENWARLSLG